MSSASRADETSGAGYEFVQVCVYPCMHAILPPPNNLWCIQGDTLSGHTKTVDFSARSDREKREVGVPRSLSETLLEAEEMAEATEVRACVHMGEVLACIHIRDPSFMYACQHLT